MKNMPQTSACMFSRPTIVEETAGVFLKTYRKRHVIN